MKTWTQNIGTVNKEGNQKIFKEMDINSIDILGLSELRQEGEGEITYKGYRVAYKRGHNGVEFLYKKPLKHI